MSDVLILVIVPPLGALGEPYRSWGWRELGDPALLLCNPDRSPESKRCYSPLSRS